MTINPYFNFFTEVKEQNLIEDLIIECIQIHGQDVIYLPRKFQKLDLIYGEDPTSRFEKFYPIEMYIQNVDGFTGDLEIISKFGLEIREQATMLVSQKRFHDVIASDSDSERIRPNEGDLLWMPMTGFLYEIKFNEPKTVFFQLGQLYMYELKIEQFQYSHENLNTGLEEIDSIADRFKNTFSITLSTGTGIFEDQEIIFQGTSINNATGKAKVLFFDQSTNTLILTDQEGKFVNDQLIQGSVSSASWSIDNVDILNNENDKIDNSKEIKEESDEVIDFDENNPFGS